MSFHVNWTKLIGSIYGCAGMTPFCAAPIPQANIPWQVDSTLQIMKLIVFLVSPLHTPSHVSGPQYETGSQLSWWNSCYTLFIYLVVTPPPTQFLLGPLYKKKNPPPQKKKIDHNIKYFSLFMGMLILSASVDRFSVSPMHDFSVVPWTKRVSMITILVVCSVVWPVSWMAHSLQNE